MIVEIVDLIRNWMWITVDLKVTNKSIIKKDSWEQILAVKSWAIKVSNSLDKLTGGGFAANGHNQSGVTLKLIVTD